ncbi:DUF952 domain-containing protein [Planctomycetes bacterium K23_9]|uniref:DUF952 domain-containing protein n=1 Tax=Stieleria marina TaxID=1930275 RepID=A0A517NXL2_9BACT|nr:hypothetical protein K239x_38690 [Planctomycetes bacterium K23_9]
MTSTIYKIVSREEWTVAESVGEYRGSALDVADGFIHLSSPQQTVDTAAKYFADRDDLLLVSVDVASLGSTLRWEASRGGDLFPHVYGVLPLMAVAEVFALERMPNGKHQFPDGF